MSLYVLWRGQWIFSLKNYFCFDKHVDAKIFWVNFVVTFWVEVTPKFPFLTRFNRDVVLRIRNCIVVVSIAVIFHQLLKKMIWQIVHFILVFPNCTRHVWNLSFFMIIRNMPTRSVWESIHVICWLINIKLDRAWFTHELSNLEICN